MLTNREAASLILIAGVALISAVIARSEFKVIAKLLFASRITVLVSGAVLVEAEPEAIRADPRVREVYLGQAHNG